MFKRSTSLFSCGVFWCTCIAFALCSWCFSGSAFALGDGINGAAELYVYWPGTGALRGADGGWAPVGSGNYIAMYYSAADKAFEGGVWLMDRVDTSQSFSYATVKVTDASGALGSWRRIDFTLFGATHTCYALRQIGSGQVFSGGNSQAADQTICFDSNATLPTPSSPYSSLVTTVGFEGDWSAIDSIGSATQPTTQPTTTTQPSQEYGFGKWLYTTAQDTSSNMPVNNWVLGYWQQVQTQFTLGPMDDSDYRINLLGWMGSPTAGFFGVAGTTLPFQQLQYGGGADLYGNVRSAIGHGFYWGRGILDAFGIRSLAGVVWTLLCSWWCIRVSKEAMMRLAGVVFNPLGG